MDITTILATLTTDKAAYDQAAADLAAEQEIQKEVLQKLAELTTVEVTAAMTLNADVDAAQAELETFRVVVAS